MKKLLVLFLSLILVVCLCACGQSAPEPKVEEAKTVPEETSVVEEEPPAPVLTISVSPEEVVMLVDGSTSVECVVEEDGVQVGDHALVWSSSDSSVVEVDDSGTLNAVQLGNAVVKVSLAEDDSVNAEIPISVLPHVSSITTEEPEVTLLLGTAAESAVLPVVIEPADAMIKECIYESSDEAIVTVDTDGTVHGVADGNAVVTAVSADSACEDKLEFPVTVKTGVSSIELAADKEEISFGETLRISATVLPDNAADKTLEWDSSDEAVATVQNGSVKGVGAGKAVITCKACDGSGTSATYEVQVNVTVKGLKLEENAVTLLLNGPAELSKHQLICVFTPENPTYTGVTWSSSDEAVAKVEESGEIVAVGSGKATITAVSVDPNAPNVKATCSVTIGEAVQSISFAGVDGRIAKGSSVKLTATITPENALNKKLEWESSDTTVLTVDANGNVRAVGVGTASVTCKATDGTEVKCSEKFTVYQAVTGLKASTSKEVLFEGDSVSLASLVTVSPEDATDKSISWLSQDTRIAKVDDKGKVIAVSAGKTTIEATAKDGSGKSCKIQIIVEPGNPVDITGLGTGIYNANLLAITVKNCCQTKAVANFDFDIVMKDYAGSKLKTSGSYSLGDDVYIGAGATQTIRRTLSGVVSAYEIQITITAVAFTDGTVRIIPSSQQIRNSWTT